MKPAWPMENCPVIPFTRFSETARMMAMPMWLMFWKTYSSPRSGLTAIFCSIRTRNGIATNHGSQLHSARGAFFRADPPKRPATSDLFGFAAAEQAGRFDQKDENQDSERD